MAIILMFKPDDGLVCTVRLINKLNRNWKWLSFVGVDSGIGAGVDSFYEYLVKGSIMLTRPELMDIFNEAKMAIDKYLSKNDWHIWASMTKGQVTIPVFQSLGKIKLLI